MNLWGSARRERRIDVEKRIIRKSVTKEEMEEKEEW
jgi:hypothetical protein